MALDNFRTIDLIWDKANKSIIKTIKTASSDTTGRYLSVKILDAGQEVTLNNAKLQLYWEHPNFNTSGTDDFNTVNNGGLFNMTFSDEMLTNIGELNAHLVLTLTDGKITSGGFPIEVIKGASSGVVIPSNGDSALVVALENALDKIKIIEDGAEAVVIEENAVGTENIKRGAVTPRETTFFVRNPENMIDPNDFSQGYVDITGNVLPSDASVTSGYIPIKPNTAYRLQTKTPLASTTAFIASYDSSQTGLRRSAPMTNFDDSTKNWFVSRENERFFRVTIPKGQEYNFYLHEGEDLLPFPQAFLFDTQYLPELENSSSKVDFANQTDYTELLKYHNNGVGSLKARIIGDRRVWVYNPISQGKYIGYLLSKNTNDDFMVLDSITLCSQGTDGAMTIDRYLSAGSNKEFAFFLKPDETSTAYWNPDHGTGTTFAISQKIMFDGVDKTSVKINETELTDVQTVTIVQKMNFTHPDLTEAVGELTQIMTINSQGATYQNKVKWVKSVTIEKGYVNMLPINDGPFDRLITSQGEEFDVTTLKANESVLKGDETLSYAYLNTGTKTGIDNLVLAQTFLEPEKSYRLGGIGRYEPYPVWVEHRTATVHKLYPQVYDNHTVEVGEEFSWGAKIYGGILDFASDLLR